MASDYHIAQLISRGKIMVLIELKLFHLFPQPIVFESLLYTRLITRHYTECGGQTDVGFWPKGRIRERARDVGEKQGSLSSWKLWEEKGSQNLGSCSPAEKTERYELHMSSQETWLPYQEQFQWIKGIESQMRRVRINRRRENEEDKLCWQYSWELLLKRVVKKWGWYLKGHARSRHLAYHICVGQREKSNREGKVDKAEKGRVFLRMQKGNNFQRPMRGTLPQVRERERSWTQVSAGLQICSLNWTKLPWRPP